MSYSDKKDLIKEARLKRGWILFVVSLLQFVLMCSLSMMQMYINGVSPYLYVPLCTFSAGLASIGGAVLLMYIFGSFSALRKIEKDRVNPINYAIDIKHDTRIAILMPVYHEDPARVGGGMMAMIEELSAHKEFCHFDWFILSDSRNEEVIAQERYIYFILKDKFPRVNIYYRQRMVNTFAKVGNTADFYRRWGRHYKFVVMLDADSMLPADSCVQLARTIEGNDNTALIQSRFYEVTSNTLFGMVSNFRFLLDNHLYTHYYNYFNPGRGFYMGHNAIIRVDAFMKYCNLPIMEKSSFFPEGKMISHDYYEGSLLIGAGYDTWILPQIHSYDQQLHNIMTFFIRERRWLVGAQTWFKFFMSKSLSNFGKVNMLQRALFYYAATVGIIVFVLSFYGIHYTLLHPLRARLMLSYYNKYASSGYNKYIMYAGLFLIMPFFTKILCYYVVFLKQGSLKKMGGSIKFIFSYAFFVFIQSKIMFLAMFILNNFLFNWVKRKKLEWSVQDRDGEILSWGDCIKNCYPMSFFGAGLLLYVIYYVFPYMKLRTLSLMGIHLGMGGMIAFKFSIIFPLLVFLFAPVIARLTSKRYPLIKKLGWLKTFYDDDNLPSVVAKTYQYTEDLRRRVPSEMTFSDALVDPWFALRHMVSLPSRKEKYEFWKDKLKDKNIEDCTRLEKLVIFRCRELWEMFFLKEYARKENRFNNIKEK